MPFVWPLALLSLALGAPWAYLRPLVYGAAVRMVPRAGRVSDYLEAVAVNAPAAAGTAMRAAYYRKRLRIAGRNLGMSPGVRISGPEKVAIGSDVGINYNTVIVAFGDITIGDGVLIGPNVLIHSGNHVFDDATRRIRDQGHDFQPITIEDDVWIGSHAVILPGVRIGRGAVVGAGSVVTRAVEPYSIVAGVPARTIGVRGAKPASRTPIQPSHRQMPKTRPAPTARES